MVTVYALAALLVLIVLVLVELVRCPFRPRLRVDVGLVALAVAAGHAAGWV